MKYFTCTFLSFHKYMKILSTNTSLYGISIQIFLTWERGGRKIFKNYLQNFKTIDISTFLEDFKPQFVAVASFQSILTSLDGETEISVAANFSESVTPPSSYSISFNCNR